jgi:hypothetical protein
MAAELAKIEHAGAVAPVVSETAAILSVIERAAMNPDVDIDKMERLLQMQERIVARNAKAAYSNALAAMQPELPEVSQHGEIKHKKDGPVQSRYARWEDIHEAISPKLAEYGFALSFRTNVTDTRIIVTAILSHRDGHSEETSLPLPTDASGSKNAVQAVGSSVSYGKRYTACAILNIRTRGDDDGGKGGDADTINESQVKVFTDLANVHKASIPRLLKAVGAEAVESMTAKQLADAQAKLDGWIASKREQAQ